MTTGSRPRRERQPRIPRDALQRMHEAVVPVFDVIRAQNGHHRVPALAARARELLSHVRNVTVFHADAIASTQHWGGAKKIICTFAIEALPSAWIDALPEGGVLVAPVGRRDQDQKLVRVTRRGGVVEATEHGMVRYVPNRSALR